MSRDRVVGGREAARQALVEPVHRLEELERGAVDVGLGVADPQDVGGGVLARLARGTAGEPDPTLDLAHVVPEHADRAPHLAPHGGAAPGVHPDHRGPQRRAVLVDGHGPRPLRGAPHADDARGAHRATARVRGGPRSRWLPTTPSGSCSAPPPGRRCNSTGSDALAAILPVGETTATLGPPVPRSTASTKASSARTVPPTRRVRCHLAALTQPNAAPRADCGPCDPCPACFAPWCWSSQRGS